MHNYECSLYIRIFNNLIICIYDEFGIQVNGADRFKSGKLGQNSSSIVSEKQDTSEALGVTFKFTVALSTTLQVFHLWSEVAPTLLRIQRHGQLPEQLCHSHTKLQNSWNTISLVDFQLSQFLVKPSHMYRANICYF